MRLKKATKMAKKRLKTASSFMKDNNDSKFYEETSKAIWGYLSDKFNINLSELSMDKVKVKLIENNVNEDNINEIVKILEQCEYARYAPSIICTKNNPATTGTYFNNLFCERKSLVIFIAGSKTSPFSFL